MRSRVLSLLKEGYLFPGRSNIIFVCGGNEETQMRPQFINFCSDNGVKFLVFQPEYAIDHALALSDEPFNLGDFEELIGHLSLAIVIFPEAPGSFAEAGYFAAIDDLAKKSILILDQSRLGTDSFLSIGPGKLIGDKTRFHPSIQMMYDSPDFGLIIQRIEEREGAPRRKGFPSSPFSRVGYFEKLTLIVCLFDILEIASIDDVFYLMKGLFNGRADLKQIQQLTSILLGAGLIKPVGETGDFSATGIDLVGCSLRDGYNEKRNALKIEVVNLLIDIGKLDQEGSTDAA